jgi:hypothetical protein
LALRGLHFKMGIAVCLVDLKVPTGGCSMSGWWTLPILWG